MVELIVGLSISITVIASGYSIVQILMKGNQLEGNTLSVKGNLEDALDFIMDEVNRTQRVIDSVEELKSKNLNCVIPKGKFLFGLKLPSQALKNEDYASKNYDSSQGYFRYTQIDCPIIYTVRKSNSKEKRDYVLERYGPKLNEKGFYESPSKSPFISHILLDGITSNNQGSDFRNCPRGWKALKNIAGIGMCIDRNNKAIELSIKANQMKANKYNDSNANIISTLAGFNRIQDEEQINLLPPITTSQSISTNQVCIGGPCCWMGVCLKTNKITFMIDKSGSMLERERHWICDRNSREVIVNCRFVTPRIQGKGLFDAARSNLRQQVVKLPTIEELKLFNKQYNYKYDEIYLQIIAFDTANHFLFPMGPQKLTRSTKNRALEWIDNLRPYGGTDPWKGICQSIKDEERVEQIILLTDGLPVTHTGNCLGRYGDYTDIINSYNKEVRSFGKAGPLIIDTISFFHDFCDTKNNFWRNSWLGELSSGAESECSHVQ